MPLSSMPTYAGLYLQVWDIRNNRCIQTLTDKQAYRPENFLTCLLYDPKHEHLMSGAVLPKVRLQVCRLTAVNSCFLAGLLS